MRTGSFDRRTCDHVLFDIDRGEEDNWLIISNDGLWDVFTANDKVEIVEEGDTTSEADMETQLTKLVHYCICLLYTSDAADD